MEPKICYSPPSCLFEHLKSPFNPLSSEELSTEWGKELYLGLNFAREEDYYRAITCYKRALFLAPPERKAECEYRLIESYFFAGKYQEVVQIYEKGSLGDLPLGFPAIKELLLMLETAYEEEGMCAKAYRVRALLEKIDQDSYERTLEYRAVKEANFETLNILAVEDCALASFLTDYSIDLKSPSKARFLNAILPGAGYYYVGQKKSALTSLLINALFTWAAYRFFERGYPAAGLITASIETGWYFGGINGAGLAAEEWNQMVYETKGKQFLIDQKLFPVLRFEYAF